MTNQEKKLLAICVKHLEKATKTGIGLSFDRKFDQGKVTIPETAYFETLAALDSINRIKAIIKERIE